jgi:two-component system chemotaxis response regulator CheB
MSKIRVLVVDNSALMRRLLIDLLGADPQIAIAGEAGDGLEALAAVERLRPDVVTLDIDMPRMNGLEALHELMRTRPTAVVVVSGLARPDVVIAALQDGAVDVVCKPSGPMSVDLYKIQHELLDKVRAAALVDVQALAARAARMARLPAVTPGPLRARAPRARVTRPATELRRVVAIAASSGGPQALDVLLPALPGDLPAALLVVQHMPAGFTASLAERLNRRCALTVREAEQGAPLEPGHVYIAPGGRHLLVEPDPDAGRQAAPAMRLQLGDDPPVRGLRPSANLLMRSMARHLGTRGIGVVLTGMGSDGAEGCQAMRRAGGRTLAQDEATSVIYGMPRAAAACAEAVLPLDALAAALVALVADAESPDAPVQDANVAGAPVAE